tara:strand:- start:705 stop:1139 length:435 start_codon:yes stop_codon:yes gene_type:complete
MPKPVLSDSLFNADDVATAVLSEANLQVTNSQLGVTDISSNYSFDSGWQAEAHGIIAYAFNGFVFININCVHPGGSPTTGEGLVTNSNSDYHPIEKTTMPSIANEADSAYSVVFQTNGNIDQLSPYNPGSSNFHIVVNGFYRYA